MQNGIAAADDGNGDSIVSTWDATELLKLFYRVDYNPFVEKRNRFRNMEGHLEEPNEEPNLIPQIEKQWKRLYFRTKDGRFQWFATHFADEHPIGDVLLTGTTVAANRDEWTITVRGGKENANITVKTPSNLFDKWLQALLSHSSSTLIDAYIQPVYPPIPHYTRKILLVELGSCSIRAGILTNKPSLPQLFFPAVGCVPDTTAVAADENSNATPTKVAVGIDAFRADVRRGACGELRSVLSAEVSVGGGGGSTLNVERYQLNRPILAACLNKVLNELQVDPRNYKVLLSIPQNVPAMFVGDLLRQLIREWRFKAASIARQPSLILYSYDVTTGVVVDIGERLSIVPVIDEYVVESAIVSLPFGGPQIRKSLQQELTKRNSSRINAFGSPIENIVLRYMVELSCNVATNFEAANLSSNAANGGSAEDRTIEFSAFDAGHDIIPSITVDSASRFHATEGLFKPKRFGVEMKGIHHLIHDAIQQSPIDSRRTLYRNIYLSGGTTQLPGFAERLELELSQVVHSSIFVQVHGSPWRYHASYLGAQVIANSFQFENCCADMSNLDEYLRQMDASAN